MTQQQCHGMHEAISSYKISRSEKTPDNTNKNNQYQILINLVNKQVSSGKETIHLP